MEAKDAHMFEANRSNLRVFSMTEVGFSLGMMLGPLLTGSLFELVGFFYMTVALGEPPPLIPHRSITHPVELLLASSRPQFPGVGWIPCLVQKLPKLRFKMLELLIYMR